VKVQEGMVGNFISDYFQTDFLDPPLAGEGKKRRGELID